MDSAKKYVKILQNIMFQIFKYANQYDTTSGMSLSEI